MWRRVTTAFLIFVCLASPAVFAATGWLTLAGPKRLSGALAGGLAAAVFNIGWDALAGRMDWWAYHSSGDVLPTLAISISVVFVFGATAGLVGWRMMRAMGWTGVATFFAGYIGLGMLRDHMLATNSTLFAFGAGPMPQVMGAVGYLSLALVVQVTMLLMAGPPRHDPLRAS